MGWILIVVGLIGFGFPGFLAMHLNPVHDIVLIVTGLISIYFGRAAGSMPAARAWCIVAGLVYGIISLVGVFCGPGRATVAPIGSTYHLLVLAPGALEFGTADNWLQLLAGVLYLFGGLSKQTADMVPGSTYASERDKEVIGR